jgi:O-antigen ligase
MTNALSGRDVVWDVVLDYAWRRPVGGWGFMALWTREDVLYDQGVRGVAVFEAHSGYLEVFIGGGLIGLAAMAAVVSVVVQRATSCLRSITSSAFAWPALVIVYALIANIDETYIGANLHPWVLLVAGAATIGVSRRSPDRAAGCGAPHGG